MLDFRGLKTSATCFSIGVGKREREFIAKHPIISQDGISLYQRIGNFMHSLSFKSPFNFIVAMMAEH